MTAQIPDQVVWAYPPRGIAASPSPGAAATYSIVGIGGTGLFDPARHGLQVRALRTGCWRGCLCTYKVTDRLVLTQLELGMDDPPDELFGAHRSGWSTYGPLSVPVKFTGGLLLGTGFRQELYVHMGFHPAWKYNEVHELTFSAGRLTAVADRSTLMAERRAAQGALEPESDDPQVVSAWIESTFDNSYRAPL